MVAWYSPNCKNKCNILMCTVGLRLIFPEEVLNSAADCPHFSVASRRFGS
jgi:hypothetical protein